MKLRLIVTAAFALLLSLPLAAAAAEGNNFYVGAGIGYSALDGVSYKPDGGTRVDVDPDHGAAAAVAFGYRTVTASGPIRAVRFELQHAASANGVKSLSSPGVSGGREVPADGDIITHALMVNMLFEAPRIGVLTPLLGVGAGWSYYRFDGVDANGFTQVDDADYAPAAQVLLGLGADLGGGVHLEFFYRARRQQDVRLKDDNDRFVDVETGTAHALTGGVGIRF